MPETTTWTFPWFDTKPKSLPVTMESDIKPQTRIPTDCMDMDHFIRVLMAAFLVERPFLATALMAECGPLWDAASESCLDDASLEEQATMFRLIARLFNELDISNYRLELVRG